ncbi:MAG: acyl--CoA ligase [Rhodospirillales bacterium]|nr:acyl--CoA ligase [Rhodospirillales bacterium]
MSDLKAALVYPEAEVRRWKAEGYWTDAMPHHALADWAARTPEASALIGPAQTLSYAALLDKVRRTAAGFQTLGLKRGDVIGFQLPNIPDFMIAYLGAQMMGAVPCMLHMPYRTGELEPLIAHAQPKAILCMGAGEKYDAPALMRQMQAKAPFLKTIIAVGAKAPPGVVAFDSLANGPLAEIADPPGPDDPAVLLFTSGTSALPKAVVHSHRTLTASAQHTGDRMGVTARDVVLCAPAHTHAFGLCVGVMMVLCGAANALMPEYSPPALAETIRRTRATVVCCGPAHILAGFKAKLWDPDTTQSIERVFTGGALCPPDVLRALDAALPNGKAYQVWGMTEVWMPILHRLDATLDDRAASLGLPPHGHQVRVCGSDGRALPPGEEGELQMRGPFLLACYYGNEKATRESFAEEGWFRTGDLAILDARGNIALTGRLKEIINRGGMKINPMDIEAIMGNHPAVALAALVPMPDEVLGEKACLFVQPLPGQTLTLEEACAHLAAHKVVKMRWPERLILVEAMPMTATRKVIKGKLKELL